MSWTLTYQSFKGQMFEIKLAVQGHPVYILISEPGQPFWSKFVLYRTDIGLNKQTINRTSRCNKVDAVRLYASYRLNLLLLKGQRCVSLSNEKVFLKSQLNLVLYISAAGSAVYKVMFKRVIGEVSFGQVIFKSAFSSFQFNSFRKQILDKCCNQFLRNYNY